MPPDQRSFDQQATGEARPTQWAVKAVTIPEVAKSGRDWQTKGPEGM